MGVDIEVMAFSSPEQLRLAAGNGYEIKPVEASSVEGDVATGLLEIERVDDLDSLDEIGARLRQAAMETSTAGIAGPKQPGPRL